MPSHPFCEYPKIKTLGDEENEGILQCNDLVISEKVDGSNVRFALRDGQIVFGTHHVVLGSIDLIPKKHLHRKVAEWILERVKPDDLKPEAVYFLEGFGEGLAHTIKYPVPLQAIGIDVWTWANAPDFDGGELRGRFVSANVAKQMFEGLGLSFVPILYQGNDRWTHESLKALLEVSQIYPGMPEGIVIKSYDHYNRWSRQLYAKLVRDEFKEALKTAWGVKKYVSSEPDLVEEFWPKARIDKKFHELVGAGSERSMKLVPVVAQLVYEDGWEENWRDIVTRRDKLDLKLLYDLVMRAVVKRLKQLLAEEAT